MFLKKEAALADLASDWPSCTKWTLAEGARRGRFPRGAVVKVGKNWLYDTAKIREWLASGGELSEGGAK